MTKLLDFIQNLVDLSNWEVNKELKNIPRTV